MKKQISWFVILTLIMTCTISIPLVSADVLNPVPADWTLLASDDFTAADNTSFADYTGGTGFISKWTSDLANTSYTYATGVDTYIKNGQYLSTNKNTTTNSYRRMQTPINLTADADYYIMFDMYSWAGGNNSTSQKFLLRDSTNTNNNLYFGSSYSEELACNLPNEGAQSGESYTRNKKIPANGIYTYVLQVSAKSGTTYDCLKMRVFTDPTVEAPSFAPQYWDEEYWLNNKAWSNLDTINISTGNGSGNPYNPILDNLKIYKSAPIYVSANLSPTSRYLSPNVTLTVAASSTNNANNPQTADPVIWEDATNINNPVQIATGSSYTVTSNMIDKILRAKVVVTDTITGAQTTYYPVARLVHSPFEVIKTTVTSSSNRRGRINYTDWTKNTSLYFNADVTRAKGDSGGSVQLIVAQYDSNNNLKKVSLATPIKINNITISQTLSLQALITLDQGTVNPLTKNYASGDYFKTYVWYSNSQTFAFDTMSPMHNNIGNNTYESFVAIP